MDNRGSGNKRGHGATLCACVRAPPVGVLVCYTILCGSSRNNGWQRLHIGPSSLHGHRVTLLSRGLSAPTLFCTHHLNCLRRHRL